MSRRVWTWAFVGDEQFILCDGHPVGMIWGSPPPAQFMVDACNAAEERAEEAATSPTEDEDLDAGRYAALLRAVEAVRKAYPATAKASFRLGPVITKEKPLLTVPEAARLLGVSENHAWNLIARGEIPSIRLGRLRRVPTDTLARHIDKQAMQNTANLIPPPGIDNTADL